MTATPGPPWIRDGEPYAPSVDELEAAAREPASWPGPPQWRDPAAMPELLAVAEAVRRGTPRSKMRLLDVTCPRSHRIGEVLRTGSGPVLLAAGAGLGAVPLAEIERRSMLRLPCRCATVELQGAALLDALATHRRRLCARA